MEAVRYPLIFFIILITTAANTVLSDELSDCECYSTGALCGWAMGCQPDHDIYQCDRVGAPPGLNYGPCRNGCIRDSPNHYCA